MFTVEVFDLLGTPVRAEQLLLVPVWYAASARGGCESAEVQVTGAPDALWQIANWIHFGVRIRNENGTLLWWGYIERATVGIGQMQLGATLEGVCNRAQTAYTYESITGAQERGTTAWAQNDASVATYGRFEERLSLADAQATEAASFRDTRIAQRAQPQAVAELGEDGGGLLTCRGWWQTLERQFYADERGVLKHDVAADIEHVIGWSLLSQVNMGLKGLRVDDLGARLAGVRPKNTLRILGSGQGNDGVYEVASGPDEGTSEVVHVSTHIIFEPSDDIKNDFNEFTWAKQEYMIRTWGSSGGANNGTFWIEKCTPGGIEVDFHDLVNDDAGESVTIRQGHGVTLVEGTALAREQVGVSLSLYHGSADVAQRFRLTSGLGWTVRQARVQAMKVGAPSDNLRLRICADNAGLPGGTLVEATVTPANVPAEMAWVTVDLGAGVALSTGTDYWIMVGRAGTHNHADFYIVGLESEATFSYGLKVLDGAAWTWGDRTPNAHMPFQLSARTATTAQLADMLNDAQWITGVAVRTASGVETDLYRDGEQKLLTEVERLLDMGTSGGGALLVRIHDDRSAVIEGVPVSGETNLRLAPNGALRMAGGRAAEAGVLPVGQWVTVEGAPASMSALASFLVERAEYDVEGGRLRLEPKGNERD